MTEGANARITIRDIAREAGVSVQTVSRVLNDRPDVAAATRAKVEHLIASMGYEPNVVAQALVSQRSRTFGYISSGLEYVGVSTILDGLAKRCELAGYGLLLQTVPEGDYEALFAAFRFLARRNVEGVAVQVQGFNFDDWADIFQIPAHLDRVVFLGSVNTGPYPNVRVDDIGGARAAGAHLVEIGRQRIAHITGPINLGWFEADDRLLGWRQAMSDANRAGDLTEAGDWTPASGFDAMTRLLERCPDLDAVFAANDQMALGAISACRNAGRSIPDDIAIVGFDGLPESRHFEPPLTTVVQGMVEVGKQAIEILLAEPNSTDAKSRVLPVELVERASTIGASFPPITPPRHSRPTR